MTALDDNAVRHLFDAQRGLGRQQLRQDAVVAGRQVLDDHQGHVALIAHGVQQLPQRFEPAGAGANAGDGETRRGDVSGIDFDGEIL